MPGQNETREEVGVSNVRQLETDADSTSGGAAAFRLVQPTLEAVADYLSKTHRTFEGSRPPEQNGFIAYGEISPGDKVLLAVSNLHDRAIVDAISAALKRRGASKIDVIVLDDGEDRPINYLDEIERIIRTEPWWKKPRWYDYQERVINYAKDNGYDMLIHGRGGPKPRSTANGEPLPFKFEAVPWQTKDVFLAGGTIFPSEVNYLANVKAWQTIYKLGRGCRVRVTDPEGTDMEFTLNEKYFERGLDERAGFGPLPTLGHLFGHPTPPLIPENDARGVFAGTTSHLTRPFPAIRVEIEGGKVREIKGGGEYGEAWRGLLHKTDGTQYPEFPDKGLFWLWELAIGTNPKVRRARDCLRLSGGGNEIERSRSGVIHAGFGTRWRGISESWAAERGVPYGHLHVHLLFPTYTIQTKDGNTLTVIENGRLKSLDDPEVREAARKYGDPDVVLSEDWIPKIPGINMEGSYDDYGRDPAEWIQKHG